MRIFFGDPNAPTPSYLYDLIFDVTKEYPVYMFTIPGVGLGKPPQKWIFRLAADWSGGCILPIDSLISSDF